MKTPISGITKRLYYFVMLQQKRFYRIIDRKIDNRKMMVNIGGGIWFRRHWKVMDYPYGHYSFLKEFNDFEHDLTSSKPFPFSDNSISFFYSSHCLEHIPQEHCQYIFAEIYRCLKPGGAIRISVPDFDLAEEAYRNKNQQFFEKYTGNTLEEKFLNFFATYFKDKVSSKEFQQKHSSTTPEELADFYTKSIPREQQKEASGNHINWWNYKKMSNMLKSAEFKEIYRSKPQESRFSEMKGTQRRKGFDLTHPELSLYVEAIK